MTDSLHQQPAEEKSPPRKVMRWWPLAVGLVLLVFFIAAGWYLSSGNFRDQVRHAIISEMERTTGGHVELRSLRWSLFKLEFEADGLTVHGKEGPGELPYVHVARLYARMKIVSMLRGKVGFRQLSIERPEVHLIVYPDGTTNQPTPKVKSTASHTPDELFNLGIERLELTDGVLLLNEQRIPLDIHANDVTAKMTYSAREMRFDGTIRAGKIDMKLKDYRPVSIQTDAEFSIFPARISVKSLTVATNGLRLDASGGVDNFLQPHVDATYKVSGDLRELAGIVRVSEVRRGTFDLGGRATWSPQGVASIGKVAVRDFAWTDPSLHVADVSGGADFTLENQGIAAPHIFIHALGGTLTGKASVRSSVEPGTAVFRSNKSRGAELLSLGRPNGSIELAVHGVSIPQILSAISTQRLPLDKLNTAGTASGTVRANWKGTLQDLVTDVSLNVGAPSAVPSDKLPVFGQVQASYRESSGVLNFDVLTLSTRATHLTASGALSPHNSLQFNLATSNLAEFGPMIESLGGPTMLPVHLSGMASFSGSATGTLKAPTITGHLDARDFTTTLGSGIPQPQAPKPVAAAQEKPSTAVPGPILENPAYWQLPRWPLKGANPEPSATKMASTEVVQHRVQSVHWDQLSADVLYSPQRARVSNAVLRHGATVINADASATLVSGEFNRDTPFTASVTLHHADVAELQSIAGYAYPVTGTLDAALQFKGTRNAPQAAGHVTLSRAVIYGQAVQSLAADVTYDDNEAEARNVRLASDLGAASGSVAYNVSTRAFQFNAHGENLRIDRLPQANYSKVHITGLLSLDASGSGTLDEPAINASLQLRDLSVNKVRVGDLKASAATQGAEMRVTSRSDFPQGHVSFDGTIHLRGDMPGSGALTFDSTNLNPLIEAFVPVKLTGPTAVDGRVDISGSLKSPGTLNVGINIARVSSNLESVPVRNDGPLRVNIAGGVARIEQFRMVGEQTHFLELRGSAEVTGERRLRMRADGDVNLKILQTIDANLMSSGVSAFGLTIGGTLTQPRFHGRVTITNGAVSYIDMPNGLSGINGTMIFNQDRLQVESLSARSGGGLLSLGGFITYERGIAFNLTGHGRDIRIRYPEGVSSTADANLTLSGSMKNAMLSGDVTVTKFALNPQFDFAMYLARTKQSAIGPGQESPTNNLHLDVHVVSTPALQVETSLARISGDVDLHIRGTAARPAVLGRVDILEGDVNFAGTKYHIERGDVVFSNPVTITPVLDMEATADVRDYDITLGLHGSLDRLSMTYRSDPPLPTGDIIALLALGRTREESINQATVAYTQSQPTLTESASNALLGQALNATVSSRVQKLFGVSRIKIDPSVGGPENAANARMTIEQQVSNKVTLTYITNLAQSAQEVIQVEYNINREVSIIGVRDQNGVVGFDVRIRKRKR